MVYNYLSYSAGARSFAGTVSKIAPTRERGEWAYDCRSVWTKKLTGKPLNCWSVGGLWSQNQDVVRNVTGKEKNCDFISKCCRQWYRRGGWYFWIFKYILFAHFLDLWAVLHVCECHFAIRCVNVHTNALGVEKEKKEGSGRKKREETKTAVSSSNSSLTSLLTCCFQPLF